MSADRLNAGLDFEAAKERRERGITASLGHADAVAPPWSEAAYRLLTQYLHGHNAPFTVEQFRAWAYDRGLGRPPDERAFGGVTQRAIRAGVMERVGYAPAASSNNSPKALYARPAYDLPSAA